MELEPKNVFGNPIVTCSISPLTGFYRDGCCTTGEEDLGMHTVCIVASREFLEFSKQKGNDLSTPRPEFSFSGVRPGDRWCLCALRWVEAYEAGMAPPVILESCNKDVLRIIPFDILLEFKHTEIEA
ncbi:MAG: DUF2237 domain-containing protein [Saprospiraceae bacterium]|mgnify:FL=1|nr:DUF2237 domain-containing protein [Candidatus Vicinibacter affinis]MBP6172810.1 DUF2237 domain-containing protein [Saprospiraceae bacterium]MBK6572687.1 DUF2237 domain-containing protein [Candidatus Vicinibacter affinis]MBK7303458.1 DUF2237 domain-containing protein [Candidatus Vicinibacter affinis]MBK7696127.1 DUF2237 domain-containing protein [Candidatus Vicinibacter affinis]